jgi:LUC7 N_terminus
MKVCDICGGLQTASDTDKRMVMHVEGKLHTGYAKIRKVLVDLKSKRDDYRRQNDRQGGRRSRSRSLSPQSKSIARRGQNTVNSNSSTAPTEKVDEGFNFSSKRLGSGLNCPETTEMRFSDYAIQMNQASGENVVL